MIYVLIYISFISTIMRLSLFACSPALYPLYDIANYWLSAIFRDLQLITLLVNDNFLAVFDIVDLLSYRLLSPGDSIARKLTND